jgi:hypothetical protein
MDFGAESVSPSDPGKFRRAGQVIGDHSNSGLQKWFHGIPD